MPSRPTSPSPSRNSASQPRRKPRPRTIELILSVTERNVWPGGTNEGRGARDEGRANPAEGTVGSPVPAPASRPSSLIARPSSLVLHFGVGISQRRQIRRPRAGVQLLQQDVVQWRLLPGSH